MKANQPMTSSVYMANRGGHCPVCSEPHVEGEAIESLDAETVTQSISCPACNAKWTDVYKMEKYEGLLVDEKPVDIPQDSPSSDRQIDDLRERCLQLIQNESLEDIAFRMARFGLSTPDQFVEEAMRPGQAI